ncbi:hypothetical protein EEL42_09495, partial [Muribaculaceae bacterium Isolate-100 (HZI)]
LLLFALGGGLGRPRRLGIPSPEGERRMTNAHLKVLHFDLESSFTLSFLSFFDFFRMQFGVGKSHLVRLYLQLIVMSEILRIFV